MNIVFTTLIESAAYAYCDAHPNQNLIVERDMFSGKFNVLRMS